LYGEPHGRRIVEITSSLVEQLLVTGSTYDGIKIGSGIPADAYLRDVKYHKPGIISLTFEHPSWPRTDDPPVQRIEIIKEYKQQRRTHTMTLAIGIGLFLALALIALGLVKGWA